MRWNPSRCLCVLLLLTILMPQALWAQDEVASTLDRAESWLLQRQQLNGSFGDIAGLEPRDTAATVLALAGRASADPGLTRGTVYIQTSGAANAPFHARRALALATQGRPVDELLSALAPFRNGGGVGASVDYHSNFLDTALVIQALSLDEGTHLLEINGYLDFLQLHQQGDGGWGFAPGDSSELFFTAEILQALTTPRQLVAGTQVLDAATSFLLARQQADGSFGDPLSTAVAFRALQGAGVSDADLPFGSPVSHLLASQSAAGDWADDVLTTAEVTRALRLYLPNLIISSLTAIPETLSSGQPPTVRATVENRGGRPAEASRLTLRRDAADGTLLAFTDLAALAAGDEVSVEWTLDGEQTATDSPFLDLHAAVDSEDAVAETDEEDNRRSLRIDFSSVADLAVWASDLQTQPSTPQPDVPFDFLVPVRNLGESEAPPVAWTATRNLASGPAEVLASGMVGPLAGGASQLLTLSLTLPEGDHTLEVKVDSDGVVAEPQEANNVTSLTVAVVDGTRPDLVLSDDDLLLDPPQGAAGETVEVSWTLNNSGAEEATADLALYAQSASGLAPSPLATWTATVAGSGQATDQASVVLPSGAHSLVLVADPDDLVRELDESNNRARQVFRPLSDLAIGWDNLVLEPGAPLAGEPVVVTATVRNAGFVDATAVDVEIYDAPSGGGVLLSHRFDSVPAQGNRSISFTWPAAPGRTQLLVKVDPNGTVDELDEANNELLRQVSVPRESGPNLRLDGIDTSQLTASASSGTVDGDVTLQLINDGDAMAQPPFFVRAFEDLDGDGQRALSEPLLASVVIADSLAAGATADVVLPLNANLAFHHALVWLEVDAEDLVAEQLEDDNLAALFGDCPLAPAAASLAAGVEWQLQDIEIESAPLVVQLSDDNGDGQIDSRDTPDVAFLGEDADGRGVFVRSGADGGELWTFRSSAAHPLPLPIGNMAAADLDGDGISELIAPRRDGRLLALDYTGEVHWVSDPVEGMGDRWAGGITVGELDGLGGPEIVVGRSVVSHLGRLIALGTGNRGRNYNHYGPLGVPLVPGALDYPHSLIADIDLDGQNELVAGDTAYRLQDGVLSVLWNYNEPGNLMVDGFSAVGQLDGDPEAEIVVVSSNSVLVLNHDGTVARSRRILVPFLPLTRAGFWGGPPTLADLDGDGQAEILVAGETEVVAMRADLSTLWRSDFNDVAAIVGLTAFDLDGDGEREVLAMDNHTFYILDGTTGQPLFTLPNISKTATELPVVADVDGDGRAEILLPSNRGFDGDLNTQGLRVLGHDSWQGSRKVWNQHAYTPQSILLDGTVPTTPIQGWQQPQGNVFRLNRELPAPIAYAANGSLSLPRVGVPGTAGLDITLRLGNGGRGLLAAGQVIDVYAGDTLDGVPILTLTTESAVRPGGFIDLDLLWTEPVTSPMPLTALLRGSDDDCQLDDNRLSFVVDTSLLPDLTSTPEGFEVPAVVGLGQQVPIRLTVHNRGTATAAASQVEIRLGDAATGAVVAQAEAPVLPADASVELALVWDTQGLAAADYALYAVLDATASLAELDETNNTLLRLVRLGDNDLPDLSLETFGVAATAVAGDLVPVQLEVLNRGADLDAGFTVALEVNGAEALRHVELARLAAGEARSLELELPTVGRSGVLLLEAVLDPEDEIAELDENNNRGGGELEILASTLSLTLHSDRLGYRAGETLQLQVEIDQQEAQTVDVDLLVHIADSFGVEVATVSEQALSLPPGQTELELSWPIGNALPGGYVAKAELRRGDDLRAQAVRAFSVAAELAVAVDLYADRSAYGAGQTAQLSGRVRNESSNATLQNLRADWRIQDAQLQTVFSRLEDLPPILPGASHRLFVPWSLDGLAPGSYSARLTVRDLQGLALASADLELILEDSSQDGAGLFGTLQVDASQLAAGAPLVSHYTVQNSGNADLASLGLQLTLLALPAGSEEVSRSWEAQLARQQSVAGTEILTTGALLPGDYLLNLTASLPSAERLLDSAFVRVERALSVGDGTILEGDAGSTPLSFTVRLSSAADQLVTVEVSTVEATARAAEDFLANAATLTFQPGETEQTFVVEVLGDLDGEGDEAFLVRLGGAQGALVGDGLARGLIRDEEGCAGLQLLLDGSLDALPGGDPVAGWQAELGSWTQRFVEVPEGAAASESTLAGALVQELDLTAYGEVLSAGGVELAVSVLVEVGEAGSGASLQLELLDASGGVLSQATTSAVAGVNGWQALALRLVPPAASRTARVRLSSDGQQTVAFDDAMAQVLGQRSVFLDDVALLEGNDASSVARLEARLSCAGVDDVSLEFATADGSALAGSDYQASSGVVTIPAGELSAVIEISVLGDGLNEEDETFEVSLADPGLTAPPIIDGQAVVLLRNDDSVAMLSVADANVQEGQGQPLQFEVSLSAPSGRTVELDYATVVSTTVDAAAAGIDFVAASGHLVFVPGEQVHTVTVAALDDALAEGDEIFRLVLSAPLNAEVARTEAVGTLVDDDLASLSIDHPTVLEGEVVRFRLRLSHAATRPVEVSYATQDLASGDGATAGEDYEATSGRLILAPGTRLVDLEVSSLDDGLSETQESFLLLLSDPLHADLAVAEGTATLVDDDGLLLTAAAVETTEQAANHTVVVAVQLSQPATEVVSVEVATEDGTALADADYESFSGTLTFEPGVTRVEVPITILADSEAEDREHFALRLSQPVGAQIFGSTAEVGIADDDRWALLQRAAPRAGEACFNLTTDYTHFERGAAWNRQPLDLSDNFDKTFRTYFGSANASRAGMVFVLQQESLGVIGGCCEDLAFNGISPSVGVEFDHGNPDHVAVGLNGSRFHNGHPAVNLPYLLPDNQEHEVRLAWNAARHQLGVQIDGEEILVYDRDMVAESFNGDADVYWGWTGSYAVSSPIQYFCDVDSCAHQAVPTVSVADGRMLEGDGHSSQMLLPLTLSCPHDEEVTVSYVTVDGTARSGDDFRFTAETVVFAPGEQSKTIAIDVFGETVPEADEAFYVDITSVAGATVRHGRATATLLSDEIPLYVGQTVINEGSNGRTEWVAGVYLEAPVPVASTLSYQLVSGTAQASSDFIAASGTLSFAAGQASIALPLEIQGDTVPEVDEIFYIDFTAPAGGVLVSQRVPIEIRDDDTCPSSNLLVNPGAEEPWVNGEPVGWTEVEGTDWRPSVAYGAHEGAYSFWPGEVPFGELRQDVDVSGFAQRIDAGLQRFAFEGWVHSRNESPRDTSRIVVEYRDAGNNIILDSYDSGPHANHDSWRWLNDLRLAPASTRTIRVRLLATRNQGTVNDGRFDDLSLRALGVPSLAVADVTVQEGASGVSQALFPVTLTCPSDGSVRVDYLTADGTAVAGEDYTATLGTLVFPAGSSQQVVAVPILGDTLNEEDETFSLHLVNPQAAGLLDPVAQGTIVEDEVRLSIDDLTLEETDGDFEAQLTLRLDGAAGLPVRVQVTSYDLEALAGEDYVAIASEIELAAGTTSLTVPVAVLGDTLSEAAEECFRVELSEPVNARLDDAEALVCIHDDDIVVSIGDVSVSEGTSGEVMAHFPLWLSQPSAETVVVPWATADETATAGVDYLAASGEVSFAPGTTVAELVVTVYGDTDVELTELFNVELLSASGADLADAMATGFIVDDDDCQSLNLLLNAGAEEGVDGALPIAWQAESGADWHRFAEPAILAVDGLRYFTAGAVAEGELRQEVDITAFAPWVDSGRQRFRFQGWVRSADEAQPDLARVVVEYLDALGQVLDGYDSGEVASVGGWRQLTDLRSAPVGSRTLRLRLLSRRSSASGESTAYFDALSLQSAGTPTLWLSEPGPSVAEGDLEAAELPFEVVLSCDEGAAISVDFATVDGGGPVDQRAEAGRDYTASSSTTMLAAGNPSRLTLPVAVLGDGEREPVEYLTMTLSNPVGAVLLRDAVQGLILDNDVPHIERGFVALETAPGDGQVKIDLGAFGDWGTDTLSDWVPYGRGDALFDLPGAYGLGGTTYDAALLVRRQGTTEQYLTTSFIANSQNSRQPNPGFVDFGPSHATSVFLLDGLFFELRQSLHDIFVDGERVGGVLVQAYEVTNRLEQTTQVDFIRYFDGDLEFGSNSGRADGGGVRLLGDVEMLFETDVPVVPEQTSAFVGLAAEGGDELAQGRYEVVEWDPSVPVLRNGGVPRDRVVRDGDGDGMVDSGSNIDISLLQRRRISDIAPGETVTYRAFTFFGQAVIDDYGVNLPPQADAGGQVAVYEGTVLSLDGSASLDSDGSIVDYRWDLDDDGSFDDAVGVSPQVTVEQNGTFPIALQVIDDGGIAATDRGLLVVLEAPPVVEAGTAQSVEPGERFDLQAGYADPGIFDQHSASVDWGDGTSQSVSVVSVEGRGVVEASHVFAEEGVYLITVCVTDDGDTVGCDAVGVTVEAGGATTECVLQPFDDTDWSLRAMGDADQVDASLAGSALHLSGDGSSLYHSGDHGAFYHRQVAAATDFRLEIEVSDFPVDEGGAVRKAALMLRTGLGAYDPRVMVTYVPHLPGATPQDPERPALQFDARALPGDGGVEIGNTVYDVPLPVRLALEKRGDRVTTYYSLDGGASWLRPQDATYHGSIELDFSALGAETLSVGVMVASYDTQVPVTAEFTSFGVCQPDTEPSYDPGDAPLCDAEQPKDVLFLLDVSGSMTASYGGVAHKLQAAQEAIAQLSTALTDAAPGSRSALVTYAGFRTPQENLAGAYQVLSGFSEDLSTASAAAASIDPAAIDPGTPTPAALALDGVIDLLQAQGEASHQVAVVWLTDGIANIDGAGRGPDAYALDELQAISLYGPGGQFLPWGEVAWSGNFNGDLGTFDGEPLANAMFQLERLDVSIADVLVYGLALHGNGVDLGTFNGDLLEYAAHVSGGRSFSAASRDALLAAVDLVAADLDCGGFGSASLAGRVWRDDDGDGLVGVGEPGLDGVRLDLFDAAGFGFTTTVSAAQGSFVFGELPAGDYTVQVDATSLPSTLDEATHDLDGVDTPHTAAATVLDGQSRTDLDFGYRATPGGPPTETCQLETFDGPGLDPLWSVVELGDADQGDATVADGRLLLTSDGSSLFHSDDNATWVVRSVSGDFRAETRLGAIPGDTGGPVRKACLMVRSSTGPRDPRVMVCFIPHLPDPPVSALQFDVRHLDGSAEELATLVPNVFLPVALAIERQGDVFSVQYSRDGGVTWVAATGQLGGSVELAMGEEVLWGLAVASYDADLTMTAAFDQAEVCQPIVEP